MLTKDIREKLKKIIDSEIEKLPEQLNNLDSKTRIELTIKIMNFILPKVESVDMTENEPFSI